jgi:hypothetical protein
MGSSEIEVQEVLEIRRKNVSPDLLISCETPELRS